MTKLTKLSFWVNILKHITYICPTLITVLYYYYSSIRTEVSKTSQYTFALALTIFVLFLIYKAVMKRKVEELRNSAVITETDIRNEPPTSERLPNMAKNAKSDRLQLLIYDSGSILITLIIVALAINILEKALIGLSNLAIVACASVVLGLFLQYIVLCLKAKETLSMARKGKVKNV